MKKGATTGRVQNVIGTNGRTSGRGTLIPNGELPSPTRSQGTVQRVYNRLYDSVRSFVNLDSSTTSGRNQQPANNIASSIESLFNPDSSTTNGRNQQLANNIESLSNLESPTGARTNNPQSNLDPHRQMIRNYPQTAFRPDEAKEMQAAVQKLTQVREKGSIIGLPQLIAAANEVNALVNSVLLCADANIATARKMFADASGTINDGIIAEVIQRTQEAKRVATSAQNQAAVMDTKSTDNPNMDHVANQLIEAASKAASAMKDAEQAHQKLHAALKALDTRATATWNTAQDLLGKTSALEKATTLTDLADKMQVLDEKANTLLEPNISTDQKKLIAENIAAAQKDYQVAQHTIGYAVYQAKQAYKLAGTATYDFQVQNAIRAVDEANEALTTVETKVNTAHARFEKAAEAVATAEAGIHQTVTSSHQTIPKEIVPSTLENGHSNHISPVNHQAVSSISPRFEAFNTHIKQASDKANAGDLRGARGHFDLAVNALSRAAGDVISVTNYLIGGLHATAKRSGAVDDAVVINTGILEGGVIRQAAPRGTEDGIVQAVHVDRTKIPMNGTVIEFMGNRLNTIMDVAVTTMGVVNQARKAENAPENLTVAIGLLRTAADQLANNNKEIPILKGGLDDITVDITAARYTSPGPGSLYVGGGLGAHGAEKYMPSSNDNQSSLSKLLLAAGGLTLTAGGIGLVSYYGAKAGESNDEAGNDHKAVGGDGNTDSNRGDKFTSLLKRTAISAILGAAAIFITSWTAAHFKDKRADSTILSLLSKINTEGSKLNQANASFFKSSLEEAQQQRFKEFIAERKQEHSDESLSAEKISTAYQNYIQSVNSLSSKPIKNDEQSSAAYKQVAEYARNLLNVLQVLPTSREMGVLIQNIEELEQNPQSLDTLEAYKQKLRIVSRNLQALSKQDVVDEGIITPLQEMIGEILKYSSPTPKQTNTKTATIFVTEKGADAGGIVLTPSSLSQNNSNASSKEHPPQEASKQGSSTASQQTSATPPPSNNVLDQKNNSNDIAIDLGPIPLSPNGDGEEESEQRSTASQQTSATPPPSNNVLDQKNNSNDIAIDLGPIPLSPNGDGENDILRIGNLEQYRDNEVIIVNSNAEEVYYSKGYGQNGKFFQGYGNVGRNDGAQLRGGTYYYVININGEARTGFISLKWADK